MVSKLSRPIEKKKVEVVKPPPPKPEVKKALAKKALGGDEMSTGKGQKLRAGAERQLAANPFTAKGELGNISGAFRVSALGTLAKSSDVQAVARSGVTATPGAQAPEEIREKAQDNLDFVQDSQGFGAALAREPDPAVRDEMVRQAMASDHPETFFTNPGFGTGNLNSDFDNMKATAAAVEHALASGAVTEADLAHTVEQLGEEGTEDFLQSMMINGNNRALGGAVEKIGEAAAAAGFERAEALAFTASESLIDAHYPTAADQRAAFEQVESYIEEFDEFIDGNEGEAAIYRTGLEFALGSAARLSARGNGYTDAELDEELKEVGPRIAQETIARLGEASRFDGRVPGALDTLGDSAKRLGARDNDDADDFRVASAMAYTQTPNLISQNLTTDAEKMAALETLNGFLAGRRESWGDAADDGFTLLRDPEALDGINNLLAGNPQLIGQLVNGGPEKEATLVQLFETITLDPNVPAAARDEFNATINNFLADEVARANENPNVTGNSIGKLLGLIQVAGNRAVEGAEDETKSATEALVKDFVKGIAAGVVGLALAPTGPVGSIVGGVIAGQVLDAIFGESPGPSEAQIRNAFVEKLEAEGIDVSSGEAGQDALTNVMRETLDALNNALRTAPPEQRQAIEDQIRRLDQLNTSIGIAFAQTVNSEGGAAGELARALDEREDDI